MCDYPNCMQLWGGCGGCDTLGGQRKKPKASKAAAITIIVNPDLPPNRIEFHHPDGRIDRFDLAK